jgi:hypothetical protein
MRQLRPRNSHAIPSSAYTDSRDCDYTINRLIFYRKKFAKLKVKFELEMRESEALVREQLRIEDVSKKLQETNE